MSYVNPSSILLLWTDPLGNELVWIAVACLVAAHFVIKKLVDVKI
jgi:Flp pilus assembly protein TadB